MLTNLLRPLQRLGLLAMLGLAQFASQPASAGELITTYPTPNAACDSEYLDIVASAQPLRVNSFTIYSFAWRNGFPDNIHYRVYVKTNSWTGSEAIEANWTLVATHEQLPVTDTTPIVIPLAGAFIPALGTNAFLIMSEESGGGVGSVYVNRDVTNQANADLRLQNFGNWSRPDSDPTNYFNPTTIGTGNQHVRNFNGVINYTPNGVEGPVFIDRQPTNVTVALGSPFQLYVAANGTFPFSYQWQINGSAIGGATSDSYSVAAATMESAGDYTVVVTGALGPPVTSSNAVVTVVADTIPPTVVSATLSTDNKEIVVVFSEPMAATAATNIGNYSLSPATPILEARLSADQKTVTVNTTSGMEDSTTYTLTMNGLTDASFSQNPLAANTQRTFTTGVAAERTLVRVRYTATAGAFKSWDNVYFDMTNKTSETLNIKEIQIFSSNITAVLHYHVYSHTNTWVGNDTSSDGWTLLSTTERRSTSVSTAFPLSAGVSIPPYGTLAFAIMVEEGTNGLGIQLAQGFGNSSDLGTLVGEAFSRVNPSDLFSRDLTYGENYPAYFAGNILYTKGVDTRAPYLASVSVTPDEHSIVLQFSERMATGPATNIGSYSFSPPVTITSAVLGAGGRPVTLLANLATYTLYTLTFNGLTDQPPAANALPANTQATISTVRRSTSAPLATAGSDNTYFNIRAVAEDVNVASFRVTSYAAGVDATYSVYLYTNAGAFFGSETNEAAWQLLSTTTVAAADQTNYFTLPVGVTIPAGQTNGFAIIDNVPNNQGIKVATSGGLTNSDLAISAMRSAPRTTVPPFEIGALTTRGLFSGGVIYTLASDVAAPDPVALSIAPLNSTTALLAWPGAGFSVQRSPAVSSGVWSNVPGFSPVTVPLSNSAQIYRLIRN